MMTWFHADAVALCRYFIASYYAIFNRRFGGNSSR